MSAQPADHGDGGLSLLELIIALMLSGLIVAAVASFFISSLRTQQEVTSVTATTSRGQLVGSMIERAVRNALYVAPIGAAGSDTLTVRTSLDGELTCQTFDFSGGSIEVTTSNDTWQPELQAVGPSPVFRETGDQVSYSFDLDTDSAPVHISGEVGPRSRQETGLGVC
jgi:type II secretory pathway pseudopilin PulG